MDRALKFFAAPLALAVLLALAPRGALAEDEPLVLGPFPEKFVWPVTGSDIPDKITYSFGPRRFQLENERYDFCRGIDINATKGSDVHAVADGEVRAAGKHPTFESQQVQIRHTKPGEPQGSKYFYTYYLYLDEVLVKEGDQVTQGQVIAKSGLSPARLQRIQFQVRDGGAGLGFAVHPMAVLPYDNFLAPLVQIRAFKPGKEHSEAEVVVTVATDEVDFVRLELEFSADGGQPQKFVYDMNEFNRRYSNRDAKEDPLDSDKLEGIEFDPDHFSASATEYRMELRFFELPPVKNPRTVKLSARALDVRGKSSEAKWPKR